MLSRTELKEIIGNKYVFSFLKSKKYKNEIDSIVNETSYLKEESTLPERIYHIIYDLYEVPKCKICDKEVTFLSFRKGYHKYCSSKCVGKDPDVNKKKKQTTLRNYGVNHSSQSLEVQEKKKQTLLRNYGVENPNQSLEVQEKIKKTNLRNYGVENPFQAIEVQEKIKKTNLRNYGVENPSQSLEVQEKKKQTLLRNYGVENPSQSLEVQNKFKQTCLEKYGVENPLQSIKVQNKFKQTCLEKYGVENPSQSLEVQEKIKQTALKTFLPKLNKILDHLELELIDSDFKGSVFEHNWRCKKCGYEFKQIWNYIQQGYTCPNCYPKNNGTSNIEKELAEFVKNFYDIKENDRQVIKPKELDIYIPDKKIALEFDGLYWHSEKFSQDLNAHLIKTNSCKEKGVRLIHIFEDEWIFKKEIVKHRLKQILNVNDSERIHARKCEIKEVDPKTKNEFLEKYHIQGKDSSVIKLGAFYNNELIALMTFSHGNISKGSKSKENVWELNRFCTNYNYHIPGIASKLLSYFKRNYEWKEIFSYADKRWSNGNVYYKLGFELDHETTPNYWYIKNFQRIHRFNLRKRPDEPKDIPEWVLRREEGYLKIWDCGNMRFVVTSPNG